ncbi:MAG: hypothetical protein QXS19_07660 [Candidatus Methanomethylicia archaeon]
MKGKRVKCDICGRKVTVPDTLYERFSIEEWNSSTKICPRCDRDDLAGIRLYRIKRLYWVVQKMKIVRLRRLRIHHYIVY